MQEIEPGEQGGNPNQEHAEQGEPEEKSPESIGASVFLQKEHGLVVLCPREDAKTEAEEKDKEGRVLRDKVVTESGVVLFSREHQYDEGGHHTILKDWRGEVIGAIDSLRNNTKDGRTETQVYYDAQGKRLCSVESNYDQNDRLQSIIRRDAEGKVNVAGSIEYEYDERGYESRKVYRDENGNPWMIVEYERDENGHIFHTIVRDGEGNIIEELGQSKKAPKQDYGDIGGLAKKDDKGREKPKERPSVKQEFDRNGKVIARIFKDENGDIKMTITYERDEVGKIFHTIITDDIGNIIGESWRAGYQQTA